MAFESIMGWAWMGRKWARAKAREGPWGGGSQKQGA